jgi:beta-phosphoglucomutase
VDGNVSNAKPDPEVFLIAAKLLDVNPENAIVLKILCRSSGSQYWKNDEHRNREESILYEAKYVFKDFTQIEKALLSLIN